METRPLTQEGEAQWLRLLQHLRWTDHFNLIFIFSRHPGVIALFKKRLEDAYRLRVSGLVSLSLQAPSDLLDSVLPLALNINRFQANPIAAPLWLDLTSIQGEHDWQRGRSDFYRRLNENREELRRHLRPVTLILPYDERSLLRELAPDLWAIRDMTLETGNWFESKDEAILETGPVPAAMVVKPLTDGEDQVIREWQRVQGRVDRGVLRAGNRALDLYLANGRRADAGMVAERMVAISRLLHKQENTPESLRDLSVSLNRVGDMAKLSGEVDEAKGYFKESLELRRQIVSRIGETPESLRDLSVSLNKVGDMAKLSGEVDEAKGYFEQALFIASNLDRRFNGQGDYVDLVSYFRSQLLSVGISVD